MNLEEATCEQLFDELSARYQGVVLIWMEAPKVPGKDSPISMSYHGGTAQAIGIVAYAEHGLKKFAFEDDDEAEE